MVQSTPFDANCELIVDHGFESLSEEPMVATSVLGGGVQARGETTSLCTQQGLRTKELSNLHHEGSLWCLRGPWGDCREAAAWCATGHSFTRDPPRHCGRCLAKDRNAQGRNDFKAKHDWNLQQVTGEYHRQGRRCDIA
eukprot:s1312_g6.t1